MIAEVAQLVEQRFEEPRVAGSIPALGTDGVNTKNRQVTDIYDLGGKQ